MNFLRLASAFCVFFMYFWPSAAAASATEEPGPEPVYQVLSNHPTWLKLLHFDRTQVFRQPRSAVADDDFFLADNGAYSALDELIATLKAMRKPVQAGAQHARCMFPARAIWLQQQGAIDAVDNLQCDEWDEWRSKYADGEVGITFASGYLGNPASFFGHLLLHIETLPTEQSATASSLLDTSLNFGADVPATDGMVPYMWNGLFGGYQARYSQAPFYRNSVIYSERQMRDSWYYALDLDTDQRKLLIAHLYEILGHNFDYLFLTQNCASRIARTLELVIDDDLASSYAPWVSPEHVVRRVAPHSGRTAYFPSRRRITENLFHTLSTTEQAALEQVWPDLQSFSLQQPLYQQLSPQSQSAVLAVLLSHTLYIQQTQHQDLGREIQHELLQARLALPADVVNDQHSAPQPLAPHATKPSANLRLGIGYTDELGAGLHVSMRPLHYDLMESDDSRMPFAALELMLVEADVYEDRIKLAHMTLFDVTNLNALQTGLPIENALAWQAKAQITRTALDCRDCMDASLHLSGGQSWQHRALTSYALIGGALRTTGYQQGFIAAEVQVGTIYDWSPTQRSMLRVGYQNAGQGELSRDWQASLEHRLNLTGNHDLRLALKKDRHAYQVQLNWGLYW